MARKSKPRQSRRTSKKSSAAEAQRRLHPNPQFTRQPWMPLDGTWAFSLDPQGQWSGINEPAWDRTIEVPFAPETAASGVGDTSFYRACWYRRTFDAPKLERGQRLILRFGAVDHLATVWLNGQVVARHEGGYTPFHADVTNVLEDGEQTLVVRAEDDPQDLAKPRGKQDWQLEPHSIWYPRTTGIWQPVWLEVVGSSWIERLSWTPNLERFAVQVQAQVAHDKEGLQLRVSLRAGSRPLADDVYSVSRGEVQREIVLPDPGIDDYRNELLWSPERPTLIEAQVELQDRDGVVLDRISSYTAVRSVGVLGDRFMLNGRPRPLRLVLDQGYWPQTGLTPPDDVAARRDVELALEMGFNGVRAHQRIADPRYLYFADQLGLLVWEEMPSAYRFSTQTVTRLANEWAQAIERDRSHPCIVAWVPMNESWGVPDLPTNDAHQQAVRALYHLTRALDPTRPVIGNDGWEMNVTDIIAIHDYDGSPERLAQRYANRHDPTHMLRLERPGYRTLLLDPSAYRGQPIMLTEFGGIALRERGVWGYSEADSPEQLERRYRELLAVVHRLPIFAGFCYTQFADTYQEANGLLRADRTPKVTMEKIASATRG